MVIIFILILNVLPFNSEFCTCLKKCWKYGYKVAKNIFPFLVEPLPVTDAKNFFFFRFCFQKSSRKENGPNFASSALLTFTNILAALHAQQLFWSAVVDCWSAFRLVDLRLLLLWVGEFWTWTVRCLGLQFGVVRSADFEYEYCNECFLLHSRDQESLACKSGSFTGFVNHWLDCTPLCVRSWWLAWCLHCSAEPRLPTSGSVE